MTCCSSFRKLLTVSLYLAGIGLSSYAFFVEISKEKDSNYVPLCEVSSDSKLLGMTMNCTAVLTSKWAKGFGVVAQFLGEDHVLNIPNCLYGLGFYGLMGLLYMCGGHVRFLATLQLYSFFVASLVSVYLAYILVYVLKDICVVCVGTYAVNFLLFVLSYFNRRFLPTSKSRSARKQREPIIGNFKKNI